MKQVNIWIGDDIHKLLIKEAGKRMMKTGKEITPSRLAADIVIETLTNNPVEHMDAKPDASIKEDKIDNKEVSKNAFDFSALDI